MNSSTTLMTSHNTEGISFFLPNVNSSIPLMTSHHTEGISFFLPNMTWLQPPGYVHQMIASTWAAQAVGASISAPGAASASAQVNNGSVTYIRLASSAADTVALVFNGSPFAGTVKQTTISSSDLNGANPPADPTHISPQSTTHVLSGDGAEATLSVPANSFTVFECTP
jgi:hypothetical protein